MGDGFGITHRKQKTALPLFHDLWQTSPLGGNAEKTCLIGLEDNARITLSLVECRKDQTVIPRQDLRHIHWIEHAPVGRMCLQLSTRLFRDGAIKVKGVFGTQKLKGAQGVKNAL